MSSAKSEVMKTNSSLNHVDLADSLRRIRLSTRLSQVKFYRQYLADLNLIRQQTNTPPTDNSIQNYMKKMESGKTTVPASCLPIYAALDGCSIDKLLTGKESDHKAPDLSARGICEFIVKIMESEKFNLTGETESKEEEAYLPDDEHPEGLYQYTIVKADLPVFYFLNYYKVPEPLEGDAQLQGNINVNARTINTFLRDFLAIRDVYKNGSLPPETYKAAVDGMLSRISR